NCAGRPSTATPSTTVSRSSACDAWPSPCPGSGVRARLAVSVSGPAGRMTPDTVDRAVPLLAAAGRALAADLA
ncbi:MAG TPA: hypothetical protein VII33_09995, partial [Nakamurella sp.]